MLSIESSIFFPVMDVFAAISCLVESSCLCGFILLLSLMNCIELFKRFSDCFVGRLPSQEILHGLRPMDDTTNVTGTRSVCCCSILIGGISGQQMW